MKVKDLINYLKDFDSELPVFIAKDSEGNGFNLLRSLNDENVYLHVYNEYAMFNFHDEYEDVEDLYDSKKKWEAAKSKNKCVVLWP